MSDTMDKLAILSAGDLTEAVRETSLLADITIGVWSSERSDPVLLAKLKADAGATGNVGRVIKNLLAGADGRYKNTKSAYTNLRQIHTTLTLPWQMDAAARGGGPRLLPTALFDRYLMAMNDAKKAAEAQLAKFIDDYDDAVVVAKQNLAQLADVVYPTKDEVLRCFHFTFDFTPVPSGVQFRGLPDQYIAKLSAGLQARQASMIAVAQTTVWEMIRERVGHLAEVLAGEDTRFRATTVEHVRDLIDKITGMNLMRDDRMNDVRRDINDMMFGVDVKDLRDKESVRTDTQMKAAAIIARMDQFGV